MELTFTVGAADLTRAKGGLLVALVDDDLRMVERRCRLRPLAERALADAKSRHAVDYTFAPGKEYGFDFAVAMPLYLEAFQDHNDKVRTATAKALDFARKRGIAKVAIILETKAALDMVEKVVEGAVFSSYLYTEYKEPSFALKALNVELLVPKDKVAAVRKSVALREKVCAAANGARDIINRPGSDLTPEGIAAHAKKIAAKYKMQFTLLKAADLEKGGFVGVSAVGAGSVNPPVMFAMYYQGRRSSQLDLALVGKGISFDTGGIDLKPFDHMWEMKIDMAGAGAVIHTMQAVAELGLKKNVVAIIPSAENRPDAKAYLPGDVLRYRNGVTVEVHSTDAEGRLILADGLIWAQEKFGATRVIDVATLTGACVRALGMLYTGLMCNDNALARQLTSCGEKCGEKFWPLPLPAEYDELLLSPVAKVKNIGGANAGASTAGLFLQHFIKEGTAWAHLDIAGSSFYEARQRYYLQPGATGVMVRALTDYIANL
jgi:leucyl aminopeptidase